MTRVEVPERVSSNGRIRVAFQRDPHLEKANQTIHRLFPTVLVLNKGAHYIEDVRFLERVRDSLDVARDWLSRCQEHGIKCHFFWRTTAPGVPHCTNFTKPVTTVL